MAESSIFPNVFFVLRCWHFGAFVCPSRSRTIKLCRNLRRHSVLLQLFGFQCVLALVTMV